MGYRSPDWFTATFEEYLLNNDSLVVDLSALFSVCFLFSLLCLSGSKLRLAEEGEAGKGKLSATMLPLDRLGNAAHK